VKKEVFFEVNDYITLKLVRRMTNIYVKGERFRYSFLLNLNKREDDFRKCDQINSIDEVDVNKSNFNHEKVNSTPEKRFSDHCLTMQAWVRSDYDTRMLQVNLAFPLLKQLMDAGDPQAKKVFKGEIIKQLNSDHPPMLQFLVNGGYLNYLNQEELISLLNLCNDNLKSDSLAKSKRVGYHALFFKLRGKLGPQKIKEWRENLKKKDTLKGDLLTGFDFFSC